MQIVRAQRAIYQDESGTTHDGPVTAVIDNGVFREIFPGADASVPYAADDAETITISAEEVLLPGLVDTHVHVNEPGRTEWEGFESATRAAAAGGVTTLIDMPLNSIPSTTTVAALEEKQAVAQSKTYINVGFWGGAVPGNLGTGDLRQLWDRGVFGFKSFLLHSGVDEFPPLNTQQLEEAMAEIAEFDGLMIVHAEDAETIAAHDHPQDETFNSFLATRPPEAEQKAITTVIAAAEKTGCRAHILHLSDSDSLQQIAEAKARGVRITVETCPHYLALFSEEIINGQTQIKCMPPVREVSNRERLWKGLVDGIIDIVVSDHSPCTAELKHFEEAAFRGALTMPGLDFGGPHTGSDFGGAWGGIASVQLGLPVVWSQARRRGRSLIDVVRWMSTGPAEWSGLPDRGAIAVGRRADYVSVRADDAFVVLPDKLHHKNKFSAYQEHALAGVVTRTWVGGTKVFDHGEFNGELQPFTLRPTNNQEG